MKVIVQGRLPEERPWRGQCWKCTSVIEATKDELTVREGYGVASCPICGHLVMFFPDKKE